MQLGKRLEGHFLKGPHRWWGSASLDGNFVVFSKDSPVAGVHLAQWFGLHRSNAGRRHLGESVNALGRFASMVEAGIEGIVFLEGVVVGVPLEAKGHFLVALELAPFFFSFLFGFFGRLAQIRALDFEGFLFSPGRGRGSCA